MTARDKMRPFITKSAKRMRDEITPYQAQEQAAAERFAKVLRTATVETTKTSQRDIQHALISGAERPLWTTTFESEWHRHSGKLNDPSTIH